MNALLDWSRYSDVRKAQVTGALVGALGTLLSGAILLPSVSRGPAAHPFVSHSFFSLGEVLWLWLTVPMRLVILLLGGMDFRWDLPVDGIEALQQLSIAVLANSILLGLLATPIGWLRRKSHSRRS